MKFPFWPNPSDYHNIELGLSRVYALLARLDNPHEKFPPIIHLAGTNGKGSTQAFLREIFTEAGYKVHAYTSPHLVSFNERIILAGAEISDEFLNECLQACKDAALQPPQIAVTFFEGITVAAFLAFSRVKANVLLLETGMGGRLDATNVIAQNLLSIITPISFDHTNFLGNSLAKIAFEKAGIIKKNCPVIIGRQNDEALKTLEQQALAMNSMVKVFGKDFFAEKNSADNFWVYKQKISIKFPCPSLNGQHQIDNAAVAVAAVLSLQVQEKFSISIAQISTALTKTFWPARLQKITSGKFVEMLQKNCELILDGSHNLQGAETILQFLKSSTKKKFVIFSMLQDKDCAAFLSTIKDEIDELICLTIPDESKSRDKNEILAIAQNLKINSCAANNFADAFTKISEQKNEDEGLILICGSLYLAGEFLAQNSNVNLDSNVIFEQAEI